MLTARVIRRKQQVTRKRIMLFAIYCLIVWSGVLLFVLHRFFPSVLLLTPLPSLASTKNVESMSISRKEIEVKMLLQAQNMQVARVDSEGNDTIAVVLDTGETVLFSPSKSLRSQISSLQLVLSRLTIENKRFSRLDLRFDKPVITLK